MTILQFKRGHDPAASQRVTVPTDRLMTDEEIDSLWESHAEPLLEIPPRPFLSPSLFWQVVAGVAGALLVCAGALLVCAAIWLLGKL